MQAERILMSRRQCAVYKIPPASSSRGHRAEDWKGNKILLGFIEVYSLGKGGGVIRILNPDLSLFVESKFTTDWDKFVDRCYDSTRYFAVALINPSGQKAYVGLGFEDRNDAFDFVGAFQKYKEEIEIQSNPDKYLGKMEERDYSLKSGEKISLSFGASTGIAASGSTATRTAATGGGLLPPPPRKLAPPPKAHTGARPAAPVATAPPAAQAMPSYAMPFSYTQTAAPRPAVPVQHDPFQPPATSGGSGESGWGDGFSFPGSTASSAPAPPAPAPSDSSGTGNLIDLD